MIYSHLSSCHIDTAPTAQWHAYRCVGSTMDCARILQQHRGLAHGSIVSARYQRRGRGQTIHRKWSAPRNSSVLMTLIVDRNYCASTALSLRVGLGLMNYLEQKYLLEPQMRWPNDIMVNDKKMAGILTQQEGDIWLIGIGLNFRQSRRWCSKNDAISISTVLTDTKITGNDMIAPSASAQRQQRHYQSNQLDEPHHPYQPHQRQLLNTIKPIDHIVPLAKTILNTLLIDDWHAAVSIRLWKMNQKVTVTTHSNLNINAESHSTAPSAPHPTSSATLHLNSLGTTRTTSSTNQHMSTATVCGVDADGALVVRRELQTKTDTLLKLYSGSIR